jgi:hypothetical protein
MFRETGFSKVIVEQKRHVSSPWDPDFTIFEEYQRGWIARLVS